MKNFLLFTIILFTFFMISCGSDDKAISNNSDVTSNTDSRNRDPVNDGDQKGNVYTEECLGNDESVDADIADDDQKCNEGYIGSGCTECDSGYSKNETGECTTDSNKTPKKILWIGNSYTDSNGGMDTIVKNLYMSAHPDAIIETARVAPGATSLEMHLNSKKTLDTISEKKWDYVILQEKSKGPIDDPDEMYAAAASLVEQINKNGSKAAFFMTWARENDSIDLIETIAKAYNKTGRDTNSLVVPIGRAFEKVAKDGKKEILFGSDGYHPSGRGSYLAASVFYAFLFRESPVGNEYRLGLLNSEDATYLQEKAWETYLEFTTPKNGFLKANDTMSFVSPATTRDNWTGEPFGAGANGTLDAIFLSHSCRIRQNGIIKGIKNLSVNSDELTNLSEFYIKIWRENGESYDLVGQTGNLAELIKQNQIGGYSSFSFSGIEAKEGDYYGFMMKAGANGSAHPFYSFNVSDVDHYAYYVNSDISGNYAWKSSGTAAPRGVVLRLQMQSPVSIIIGASIVSGQPNFYIEFR